jgi:hypothetical protein
MNSVQNLFNKPRNKYTSTLTTDIDSLIYIIETIDTEVKTPKFEELKT